MRMLALLAVAGAAVGFTASGCGSAAAADPLIGTSWQLTGIDSMAPDEEPNTTIDDPRVFTVAFGDDGRAAFQVDCNRGSSTFQSSAAADDSGSLTFGPIALTRMSCPQPSADAKVTQALGRVRSYLIQDGALHLSLEADSGIMNWRPSTG